MPLNGSGTYAAPASTFNPAVTNTAVNSTDWTALLADITTALSTALYKDGQATPTADIPMGGFKLTGLGAGSATGNSLRYEQLFTTSAVALLGAMDWVKGADVASAATTNLTTATGNAVHVTGTTTITAVTLGSGMWRLVIFDSALTLTHHTTNNNLPGAANITTAAGDRAIYWSDGTTVYCVDFIKASGAPVTLSPITNTLSGNVTLNNTGTFFDGPSVAQGTAGTWFASGTVVCKDTAGAANFDVKLWDGTTVIASTRMNATAANVQVSISISGYISSPAGNIRISVKDSTNANGLIEFNASGSSKDATISVIRIA